jgi:putative transposase
MKFRKHIRLKEYDYSQEGGYFVTINTSYKQAFFGDIQKGDMILNKHGEIVEDCLIALEKLFPNVMLDIFQIMPDHIHFILFITEQRIGMINHANTRDSEWRQMKNSAITLGKIVRSFKAKATSIIRTSGLEEFAWQQNYYEHIIRNDEELNKIREYVVNNPLKKEIDKEFLKYSGS